VAAESVKVKMNIFAFLGHYKPLNMFFFNYNMFLLKSNFILDVNTKLYFKTIRLRLDRLKH